MNVSARKCESTRTSTSHAYIINRRCQPAPNPTKSNVKFEARVLTSRQERVSSAHLNVLTFDGRVAARVGVDVAAGADHLAHLPVVALSGAAPRRDSSPLRRKIHETTTSTQIQTKPSGAF